MTKKTVAVFIAVIIAFAAAGCGGEGSLREFLSQVSIEDQFPEVPGKSFKTMDEARYALYEQELGACRMYYEAYSECDYTKYADVFGQNARTQALCNERRMEFYTAIDEKLKSNMLEILSDVTDCGDKNTYAYVVGEDCVEFYGDLHSLEDNSDVDSAYASILKNYADSDNIVAQNMIFYCKGVIIDAVEIKTRKNINCDESDIKIYINENTQMIEAMNKSYGEIDESVAEKISKNNHALYERLAESMGDLSDEDRDSLFEGITEPLGL